MIDINVVEPEGPEGRERYKATLAFSQDAISPQEIRYLRRRREDARQSKCSGNFLIRISTVRCLASITWAFFFPTQKSGSRHSNFHALSRLYFIKIYLFVII